MASDTERLDWLDSNRCHLDPPPAAGYKWLLTVRGDTKSWGQYHAKSIREAIDAAMAKEREDAE